MPDPQPGQMELVRRLAEDGQLDGSTDAPAELVALAQLVLQLVSVTRPTADLGDDGELVERLRLLAKGHKFDAVPVVTEAADRLILYREAREVLANRIAAAIQQARDEIGATEQQRLAFAYAEAAMRAALTHARQEGDK